MKNEGISTLFAFVLGGVVGAAAATLLTPRAGKQNRETLGRMVDNVRGNAVLREKKLELRMFEAVDGITNQIIDVLSEGAELTDLKKAEILASIEAARLSLDAGVLGEDYPPKSSSIS